MAESTFISTAKFTKYIGVLKEYPFTLFDIYNGAIFTPNDITTLFKDLERTQPVTAPGDPVAVMLDISGRNNHFTTTTPGTYQVVGGKGCVRFSGAGQGMRMSGTGLDIFAASKQSLCLIRGVFSSVNTFRTMFRANVAFGNNAQLDFSTGDTPANLSMGVRRLQADAVMSNIYARTADKNLYTFDINWISGAFNSYRDGAEQQTKTLPSSGVLPAGPANGIFLAEYNSTRYAQMDFYGGIIISGVGDLSSQRVALETWLNTKS